MNKNGEKTKLLAAVAVLAMIMCVFAVALPAADAASITGEAFLEMDEDEDGVINLDADVTVSSVITVNGALTINGNGYTITADSTAAWTGNGTKNIISINDDAGKVVLNDVTFVGASGVNVYNSKDVTLNNVTVKDSKGAGLTVGQDSAATVNESSFSNNAWGDINVDKAATLNIDDATELTSNFQIWSEDVGENGSTINADSYVAYKWVKTGTTDDGRAYFKNGNTAGDLTLASGETLTVEKDQYLFVNGAFSGEGTIKGVYFLMPAGTTSTISGSTITVTGSAATSDTTDAIYNKYFSSVEKGVWAYAGIVGLQGEDVKIKQTNPALSAAWPSDTNFSKNVKEKTYTFDESDDEYMFLVPAGKSVTIEMTGGIASTYVFNFGGVDKTTEFSGSASASDVNAAIKDGSMAVINTTDGTIPDDLQVTDAGLQINAETTAITNESIAIGTYDNDTFAPTATVTLKDFQGSVVIRQGSVEIDQADIGKGTIEITPAEEGYDGKVIICSDFIVNKPTANETVTINVPAGTDVKIEDGVKILGNLIIGVTAGTTSDKDTTVTLSRSSTLTIDGSLTLDGVKMDSKGTITTTVDTDNAPAPEVVLKADSSFTFTGNLNGVRINDKDGGEIVNANTSYENASFNDMKINNKTVFDGSENYSFTINGDVDVQDGANFLVGGKLIVPTGSTLTIEKGGILDIKNTAIADISGELVLEDGAIFSYNGYTMTVSGTITVEGAIAGDGFSGKNVTISGTMDIEDKASIKIENAITVAAGGNLNINGGLDGKVIDAGTVTIDSETDLSGLAVSMRDGGVLNAENVRGTVSVNDDGMKFRTEGKDVDVDSNPKSPANTINLNNVTGVVITETLTMSTDKDGNRLGTSHMYVSGNVGLVKPANSGATVPGGITVTAGMTAEVADQMTLAKGVTFTVNGDNVVFTVSGAVTATAEDGTIAMTNGELDVTGTVTTKEPIQPEANVNAAHYTSGTGSEEVNVYTTLESALTAGATDIDVYGTIEVTANATIPVGTDVTLDTGAEIVIKEGVTLTVDAAERDSGTIDNSNGKITVNGTLYVANLENSDIDSDGDAVVSDVTLIDEPSATFTSVANALAAAQPGSTVEITKDGTVLISKDLTIPAGVTLFIPEDKDVDVKAGVTVTVDGTLTVDGANGYQMLSETKDGKTTVAKTVVNGMVKAADDTVFVSNNVAGAYYLYDGYDCISTLEVADDIINDIESDITVLGDVTSGDVSFAYDGGEGAKTLTVDATASLTASSIAASNMTLEFLGATNATVNVADGTFVLKDVTGAIITDVQSFTQDNVEQHMAVLNGTIQNAVDKDKSVADNSGNITKYAYLSGSVTVSGTAQIGSSDESVTVTPVFKDNSVSDNSKEFEGDSYKGVPTFTVAAEANVEFADAINFGGDVVISGDVVLDATGVEFNGNLTVTGTFAVKTGENYTTNFNGKFTTDEKTSKAMYVGITADDYYLGAAANVDGIILGATTVAYVGPNATVSDDITDAQGVKSTVYSVDGATYATAYANGSLYIGAIKNPVIENRFFQYWTDEEGTQVSGIYTTDSTPELDTTKNADVGDEATVYAKINAEVYRISILANQAVDDITIDGNLMYFSPIDNYYTATVDAGVHKIMYTLKNGYSGEGVLSCVYGEAAVSGLDFTASGTPEADSDGYIYYTFQLTGFEKTGYVPESPDTGDSDSADTGMTITDYLLIVLVVLIIVMAIIVAMRLMRS